MIPSELRCASVSDIHLGHPNTPTQFILRDLDFAFADSSDMRDLDIIYIVGDVFDRALLLHDDAVDYIERWVIRFLKRCRKHDVVVRVLEGTPSHDRKQSKMFQRFNDENHFEVDLKYVDVLSIEYIERFGIHILYIPDEWGEPDDVWKQVNNLLDRNQLSQVDFTLLHGAMDYQLPDFVSSPKHSTERYLSITRLGVFVGHVHIPSQRQHLFSNGSFSRLCHGEEHPKGHWRCTFRKDGNHTYTFIENKNAAIYKTVDCTEFTIEQCFEALEFVEMLPEKSNIRIIAERGNPVFNSVDVFRKRYPWIRWTTDFSNDTKTIVQSNLLVDMRQQYRPIEITVGNISQILMERIRPQVTDNDLLNRCQKRLEELL